MKKPKIYYVVYNDKTYNRVIAVSRDDALRKGQKLNQIVKVNRIIKRLRNSNKKEKRP